MTTPRHAPVLLDRVVALLAPALEAPGAVYVDCTLGLGGHSQAVLERPELVRPDGDQAPIAALGGQVTGVREARDEQPLRGENAGALGRGARGEHRKQDLDRPV